MTAGDRRLERFALLLLLVAAFAFPLAFSIRKSVTMDEVSHIAAGYSYWRTGEVVLNPMHPPLVKQIAALPLLLLGPPLPVDEETIRELGKDITYQWELGKRFLAGPNRDEIVLAARGPAVLLSAALAALIFVWARRLWGPAGGFMALFLYVFDPTITAHAQLVTTDVGFALFAALFAFLLRRWVASPSPRRLIFAGVALGLAFGAKFSAVALPPIALTLVGLSIARDPPGQRTPAARTLLVGLLVLCGVAAAVLWAIYLFPPDLTFYAHGFGKVQVDYNSNYLHYFMGEFRTGRWLHYFLVAWLVKTPLPAILTVLLALWLFFRGRRSGWLDESFVLAPGLALFAGYSLGADPLGIRYIIPCYPFLFVFAGRVGPWLISLGRRGGALAAALALWYVAEFAAVAPDHLSYFNQIAGGPAGGLAWLDDSNVDWGQGLIQLRDYVREHRIDRYRACLHTTLEPRYYGLDGEMIWIDDLLSPPEPGILILSGHCLARTRAWLEQEYGDGTRNWLANREPKAVVGHANYIYEIAR